MERVDLQYLCTAIGNLSGIPVRVYENGIQTFYTSMVDLPKDPLTLCRAEVFAITDHVGYYITPQFHYYGVLNAGTVKLVVGPTRQVMEREQDLRELAFRLDLSGDEAEAMLSGMRSIVRMPVESVLQMLCTINYVFNHERLELKDLRIYEQEQTALISRQVRQQAQNKLDPPQLEHNTYDLEQRLLRMVRKGDTAALRQWLDRAPAVRSGVVAGEPLRQRKNLFIVTVTLVSRAAIQGGMQVEDAFTLSDSYIQQCELTASPERIANLQYRMLLDYAERVERLHRGAVSSRLTADVANYVHAPSLRRNQNRADCPCAVCQPPVPVQKIQRKYRRNADRFHSERKNGRGQASPPLFGQISHCPSAPTSAFLLPAIFPASSGNTPAAARTSTGSGTTEAQRPASQKTGTPIGAPVEKCEDYSLE